MQSATSSSNRKKHVRRAADRALFEKWRLRGNPYGRLGEHPMFSEIVSIHHGCAGGTLAPPTFASIPAEQEKTDDPGDCRCVCAGLGLLGTGDAAYTAPAVGRYGH